MEEQQSPPQDQTAPEMNPAEATVEAAEGGPNNLLSIVIFVILAGTVIGLFLWWVWIKSPLVLWLKIVLTIIPFAIFAALI